MASSHVVIGAVCAAVATKFGFIPIKSSDFIDLATPVFLGAVGSLLPDIDHPKSKFGSWVPFLSYPISYIFGHRGITHSLLMVVTMLYWLLKFPYYFLITKPLFIGYISHLLADMLTKNGIPLLWPRRQKFKIPLISFKAGSSMEMLVTSFLIGLSMVYAMK